MVGIDEGTEPYVSLLKRNCMAKATIHLRVGAQVLLIKARTLTHIAKQMLYPYIVHQRCADDKGH